MTKKNLPMPWSEAWVEYEEMVSLLRIPDSEACRG